MQKPSIEFLEKDDFERNNVCVLSLKLQSFIRKGSEDLKLLLTDFAEEEETQQVTLVRLQHF